MKKFTKVYTRRGDKGQTDLVGGIRISKAHNRLDAYGTIDELNSHIGLLMAMLPADSGDREQILRIQNNLFIVGTHLATDQSQTPLYPSAILPEGETELLEQLIDEMNGKVPIASGFILPGGTMASAECHVCRTVCRRAERHILRLMETDVVGEEILKYINRLSDYLFVLARKINSDAGQEEIIWQKP